MGNRRHNSWDAVPTKVYEPKNAYDEARRLWAQSLPTVILNSLVEDYRRGNRDEDIMDAVDEYHRRKGLRVQPRSKTLAPLKTEARCAKHSRGTRPDWCERCKEAAELASELRAGAPPMSDAGRQARIDARAILEARDMLLYNSQPDASIA